MTLRVPPIFHRPFGVQVARALATSSGSGKQRFSLGVQATFYAPGTASSFLIW
jgi:hypothetical protein